MLKTHLEHLESEQEIKRVLSNNENVVICCGWNAPMCNSIYQIMERLQMEYPHVTFRDLDYDTNCAQFIKNLPECALFRGIPFIIYHKKGRIVNITTCVQSRMQIKHILDREFGSSSN